jgi:hypothetical protein
MVDTSLISHSLKGLNLRRPLGIVTRKNRTLSLSSSAMVELLRSCRIDGFQ